MKLLLLACFVGLALAEAEIEPQYEAPTLYYHETVGIKEATRIKAAEEASDFSGARIVGGSATAIGQYPHLGGLVIQLEFHRTSICGSSLISNRHVVTAAHCWWDGRNQGLQLTVVLGSVTLFSGGTRVEGTNVFMHPHWNPSSLHNNVAVVTFSWVNYNNNIRSIAIATGSNDFAGTWAWAAGYGKTSDATDISVQQRLYHVNLQVITNAVCQQTFRDVVTDSILCTSGADGRNTCAGDSGGPLEANIDGQRTLIGIKSFGANALTTCERGFPSGFSRVTSFSSWILGSLLL